MIKSNKQIYVRRALLPSGWADNVLVILDDHGGIQRVIPNTQSAEQPSPFTLLPALIDTHIHGSAGADVMDATHESLNNISRFLASKGVGAFLATTVTAHHNAIERALVQVKNSQKQGVDGAEILGSYLEGPFFTAQHKGAHPQHLLHQPEKALLQRWIAVAEGSLKCVALAPEHPTSLELIPWLKSQGVRVMIGHSSADYALTQQGLNQGADGVVHCYNGMNGLHHREPGMVGAALTHDQCQVELICDGHHVHPAAINVVYRCCGERLLLITDAMRAAGMPDGEYSLGEMTVQMKNGVVRTESGSLAGSTLTLERGVSTLQQACNISFAQAWLHGSLYPAKALGIADRLGSIAHGKQANLTLCDTAGEIQATFVQGKLVFQR
ncbi:N-acetylglucosamine-6-phosphate deacetylase [Providencia stuartii]|nr:N-acetylglucosamine-6-phosphate deacetylase [Providencia stuartii]